MPSIEIPGFGRVGMQQIVGAILAAIAVVGALVGVTTGSSKGAGSDNSGTNFSSPARPSTPGQEPGISLEESRMIAEKNFGVNPTFKERLGLSDTALDRLVSEVDRQHNSFMERSGATASNRVKSVALREHARTPELTLSVGDKWKGEIIEYKNGGFTVVSRVRYSLLDMAEADGSIDDITAQNSPALKYGIVVTRDDNYIYITSVLMG